MIRTHPEIHIPTESHWIPIMYEFHGMAAKPLGAFIDIMERVRFVEGVVTIDRMLGGTNLSRTEFFAMVERRLGGRAAVNTVEVNDAIFETLAEIHGKTRWGEKTPGYGFYMGTLQRLWPNGRFVHLIRDGRDVARSMSRHPGFRRMLELGVTNWVPVSFNGYAGRSSRSLGRRLLGKKRYPLEAYLALWQSRMSRILDESRLLSAGSYLEVRFERLIAEPRRTIAAIGEFLELPIGEEWLDHASALVDTSRVGRGRNQFQEIRASDADRRMLSELGYEGVVASR